MKAAIHRFDKGKRVFLSAGILLLVATVMWQVVTNHPKAATELRDSQGRVVGTGQFTQEFNGLRITVRVSGLPAGLYPLHLHSASRCLPPDFRSSGGVLTTFADHHETVNINDSPPPVGTLPSIKVDADGTGNLEILSTGVTMNFASLHQAALMQNSGTSLVLHETNKRLILACGAIAQQL
jgi:superoxide dismutase, Cu-Zn family